MKIQIKNTLDMKTFFNSFMSRIDTLKYVNELEYKENISKWKTKRKREWKKEQSTEPLRAGGGKKSNDLIYVKLQSPPKKEQDKEKKKYLKSNTW